MESKTTEQPGILFPDDDKLFTVSLDGDSPVRPGGTARGDNGVPSKYDSEPLSRKVIHHHTPSRTRTVAPPKLARAGLGDRFLFVLTVVAVVVAFIALLVGGLGLSRRGDIYVNVDSGAANPSSGSATVKEEPSAIEDGRVWLFAIGDYDVSLEYIDEASGEVRGYNVDIINAVCRIAKRECSLVWDVYTHCWEHVAGESPRPGIGLQGGWYDACTGWAVTYPRTRTFKFTESFSKQHLSVFMIPMEADPQSFNWRDLTGKTIGFLQSYADDATCLKRIPEITGNNLVHNQVRYYTSQQDLLTAVNNGEVDAVFVSEYLEVTDHLQSASDKLGQCTIDGQAMMVKKDSALPDWWNPAFDSLLDSPEYLHICRGIEDGNAHGSEPGPDLSEHCIGF